MPAYPNYPLSLIIQAGTLTPGTCFRNEQQRLIGFASNMFVQIPSGFAGTIVSPSTPTVEQQSYLWIRVDSFNNPIDQFLFSSLYAAWVYPHEWPPDDGRRILYTGLLADIATLDGGSAAAVTPTTGPFWEIDTGWTSKVPLGTATVAEVDANTFDVGTPAAPQTRTAFFLQRTARIYRTP